MALYIGSPRVVLSSVRLEAIEYIVGHGSDGHGWPNLAVIPQQHAAAYYTQTRYAGEEHFNSAFRKWNLLDLGTTAWTGGPAYFTLSNSSTPLWSGLHKWGHWFSKDGSASFAATWYDNSPETIYGNVAAPTGSTIPNTTIVEGNDSEAINCYVASASEVWVFTAVAFAIQGGSGVSINYQIWNGVAGTASASVATGWNTVKDGWATNPQLIRGPGDLLYVVYELSVGGVYTANIRTIDVVTKAISAVLVSFPLTSFSTTTYRRMNGQDVIYTFGTDNYFCAWFSGGVGAVYKFQTSTPSTLTVVYGTLVGMGEPTCASIEYDPVGGSAYLVGWGLNGANNYPVNIFCTSQSLAAASWAPVSGTVLGLPGDAYSYPADLFCGVVSSQLGGDAHTLLLFRTLTSSGAFSVVPNEHVVMVKTWNTPTLHEVDATLDLGSSFDVQIATSGSIPIGIEAALEATITVALATTRSSLIYSRWALVDNTFVDVESIIDLYGSFETNVSLTSALVLIEAQVDLWDTVVVSVDATVVQVFELTQYNLQTGTSWMTEFMGYVNADRVAGGLIPYKVWGEDALSTRKQQILDLAQRHAQNMADVPFYAHESTSFPVGYQTILQRTSYVTSSGGGENNNATLGFTFEAVTIDGVAYPAGSWIFPTPLSQFTAWKNSPGHYANIMYDWSVYLDAGEVYATMGIGYGDPDPAFALSGTQYKVMYLCNNFVPLKETFVELQFGQYWEFNGATISILDQGWTNAAYANVKHWQESLWGIKVAVEHVAPSAARVASAHVAPTHYSVSKFMEAVYQGTVKVPTVGHIAQYAIRQEVARTSHEASYAASVRAAQEFPYQSYAVVTAAHTAGYEPSPRALGSLEALYGFTPRALALHTALYEPSVRATTSHTALYEPNIRLIVSHTGFYDSSPRVAAAHTALYEPNIRLIVSHTGFYDSSPRVAAAHTALYEPSPKAAGSHEALYDSAIRVTASMETKYTGLVRVLSQFDVPSVMPTPVRGSCETGYSLDLYNKARAAFNSYYALSPAGGDVGSTAVTVTHNGKVLRVTDGYITSGKGDAGYRFEVKINDLETFKSITELDALTVEFAGETYAFIVSGRSIDRTSPASVQAVITAVSPAYLLDLPYSAQMSYTPPGAMLMSEIVTAILGVAVGWEVPDWVVPLGRAQVTEATPLAAANALLGSIAASIQSAPDGSMVARYAYPSNWDILQSIATAHTFDDGQDIMGVNIGYEYRKGFNKYRIRDSDSSYGDTIDWTRDESNELTGVAKVTPYPYRASWVLATTSESPITIEDLGEVVETITDLVEFIAGVGTLSRPIIGITSLTWASSSLGGVSFDAYSSKLTAATTVNEGYGLAKVVYTSKAFQFQVTTQTPIESAQLIVKEN